MRMSRELEALLGRAVDVVSAGGLKTRDRMARPITYHWNCA
jgi:predicted nucleotidyltransferase